MMRVRALLWLTAIASSVLGGAAVYVALSVPNDLKADAMLKTSRAQIAKGDAAAARDSLSNIIQQYPRTDAAAAATIALARLIDQERARLAREVATLKADSEQQSRLLTGLQASVTALKNAPPPPQVIVEAPKRKAPPTKKPAPPRRRRSRK